jgi:hypothetical protein
MHSSKFLELQAEQFLGQSIELINKYNIISYFNLILFYHIILYYIYLDINRFYHTHYNINI